MGGPDPVYVASVAETVRTNIEQSDDPADFRRHLHELRDTLREADLDGDLYDELLEQLRTHIDRLYHETPGGGGMSVDEGRKQRILDDLHRVERFCQRQRAGGGDDGTDRSRSPDGTDPDTVRMSGPTVNIEYSGDSDATHQAASGGSETTVDDRVDRAFERLSPCSNWDGQPEIYDYHDPTSDWDCGIGTDHSWGESGQKPTPERLAEAGFRVAVDSDENHALYLERDGEKYIVPMGSDRVLGQGRWRGRIERIVQ